MSGFLSYECASRGCGCGRCEPDDDPSPDPPEDDMPKAKYTFDETRDTVETSADQLTRAHESLLAIETAVIALADASAALCSEIEDHDQDDMPDTAPLRSAIADIRNLF